MNSRDFFVQVAAVKGQTDMAEYVSLRDQRRMAVPIPPLNEQRHIAAVLGALDDRIDVNRRMNRTLEAMAQALFRSRLVDFDGRDDLVAHEAGPIPEGWRWGKPADLIKFDPRMKLKKGTVARYLGMSEVPTEGFAIGELEQRPYKGGSKFILGDTLLARITPSLENGKTALVDFLEPGETGFGSTEFIVMRGREGTPREYVYCLARSPEFRQFAIKHMTGSSGRQRVKREHFDHYDLPVPPLAELAEFAEATRPMFDRISLNHRQSRTLAVLRDALLPKLVSGEIRVPEPNDAVEAVL
jgi:type I restriction enzyme S subunit